MIRRLIICATFVASLSLTAMTPEEAAPYLDQDQGLVLKSRPALRGEAVRFENGQLVFRALRGGGSLEYRINLDDIDRLQFPGNEVAYAATEYLQNNEPEKALPLMRAIYQQRADYYTLLTPGEQDFLTRYVELEFRHGSANIAIAIGKSLIPHAQNAGQKRRLEDLVLLGDYRQPVHTNTRELAEDWIAANKPYGPSALGFYVLGRLEFDEENYDDALWSALEPIAFSSQFPMDYLDYCYALAIAACVELKNETEEKKLRAEMTERGIAWPTDIEDLAAYQQPKQPLKQQQPES